MDPVLQRAMFQQQQQQQQAMTEADNVKSAQGLQAVAQQMQNVNTEIDNAEDVAGIMNAIRGDNATVEQRRAELAQEVGEADAKATPESVLVMLQPTFEMMESLTGQSPDMPMGDAPVETFTAEGTGITSGLMPMPDEGKKKDNFRSEEAIARINAGEMPVKARDGISVDRYNVNQNLMNQMFGLGNLNLNTTNQLPMNINTLGNPLVGDFQDVPTTADAMDYSKEQADAIMKRYQPVVDMFAPDPAETKEKVMAERLFSMEPYLTKKYTPQENLAQLKALYGDTNLAVPANLAVAKFGANIAKGTGSLADAAFGALPGLTTDLSALAIAKRKSDRDLIAQASTLSTKQGTARDAQIFDIAKEAMKRSDAIGDKYQDVMKDLILNAEKTGLELTKFDIKNLADKNFKIMEMVGKTIRGQKNYGKIVDGKIVDLKRVFETSNKDRPKVYYENGQYIDLPDDYIEVSDGQLTDLANTAGGIDFSKAKTEVISYIDNRIGENGLIRGPKENTMFITPTGTFMFDEVQNKMVPVKDIAKNFKYGNLQQNLKEVRDDRSGDVTIIDRISGKDGRPATYILSSRLQLEKVVDENGDLISTGKLVDVPVHHNPYKISIPETEQEDNIVQSGAFAGQIHPTQPTRSIITNADEGGHPLAKLGAATGLRYEDLTRNEKIYNKKQTYFLTQIIENIRRMKDMGLPSELYGLGPGLKRLSNAAIAPLTAVGSKSTDVFGQFIKTEQAKTIVKAIERDFVAANLIGEKNPVTEQQIYRAMFPDGKTFSTKYLGLTELITLEKELNNRLNKVIAQRENTQPVIYEDMPLGLDKTSAIPLENKKFRSMLTFQQANGDNINGIHVSIPRQALETSLTRERNEYLRQSQVPGISQQKKEELEKQVEKMDRFIGNLAGQGNRIFYKIGQYGKGL